MRTAGGKKGKSEGEREGRKGRSGPALASHTLTYIPTYSMHTGSRSSWPKAGLGMSTSPKTPTREKYTR